MVPSHGWDLTVPVDDGVRAKTGDRLARAPGSVRYRQGLFDSEHRGAAKAGVVVRPYTYEPTLPERGDNHRVVEVDVVVREAQRLQRSRFHQYPAQRPVQVGRPRGRSCGDGGGWRTPDNWVTLEVHHRHGPR